jgi:hypothetical protein
MHVRLKGYGSDSCAQESSSGFCFELLPARVRVWVFEAGTNAATSKCRYEFRGERPSMRTHPSRLRGGPAIELRREKFSKGKDKCDFFLTRFLEDSPLPFLNFDIAPEGSL